MGMPLAWLFRHCCKLPLNLHHQHAFNAGISSVFFACCAHATWSLLLYLHPLLFMTRVTLFLFFSPRRPLPAARWYVQ